MRSPLAISPKRHTTITKSIQLEYYTTCTFSPLLVYYYSHTILRQAFVHGVSGNRQPFLGSVKKTKNTQSVVDWDNSLTLDSSVVSGGVGILKAAPTSQTFPPSSSIRELSIQPAADPNTASKESPEPYENASDAHIARSLSVPRGI